MGQVGFVLDFVLCGGVVIDGTGAIGFVTDVALAGDRIARVGDCAGLEARERIDCRNLVVAPGFIDLHGHSDEILLVNPFADSKIRQGITTELGGNCGASPGPLSDREWAERRDAWSKRYGLDIAWRDLSGFFVALERSRPALNFCCLVGLGETRDAVGGVLPQPLDAEQLGRECELVREACRQGAVGVSSGLIYPPGRFADTNELVALAKAAASAGSALYASHLRSEGDQLIEAVDEALEIGSRAEVAVQLSHHKASGKKNWGKVHDTLTRVERARARGLDVALDQYPYMASSTGLDALLPADINVGGREEVARRLADPAYAALVVTRLEIANAANWNDILISTVSTARNKSAEGLSIAQVARATGESPAGAVVRLLVEERLNVSAISFTMCEPDVRTVLSYQHTGIGTDSSARSATGPTSAGKPHPRAYGTFPRIFNKYVRSQPLLTREEAVRRATTLAASRLGLRQRGKIAENWYADIAVFDADSIGDTATYAEPHRYPVGVRHVFVNGKAAVRDDTPTGELAGRVLLRGRDL